MKALSSRSCVVGSRVDCAFDVTPDNTALLSGQSAVLRCRVNYGRSNLVYWYRRVNGGAEEVIASECTVWSQFTSVYNLTNDGRGQCDLVIRSVDASLTGAYSCHDGATQKAQAYLTIIGECCSMCC